MPARLRGCACATVVVAWGALAPPARLAAQSIELVGVRARGMAGAFVAIADGAAAVAWNPAGLALGPLAGVVVEGTRGDTPRSGSRPGVERRRTLFLAATTPALGVSYARERVAAVETASGVEADRTGTARDERVRLRSVAVRHLGVTLLQSLADGLAVGTTLRWVRGRFETREAQGPLEPADRWWTDVAALRGKTHDAFDLDVGALAAVGRFRVGAVWANLREPALTARDGTRWTLRTTTRVGVAVRLVEALVLEVDADVRRRTPVAARDDRRAAVGGEWRAVPWASVRAGVSRPLTASAELEPAAGTSIRVGRGVWLDAFASRSAHPRAIVWGLSGRVEL